MRGLESLKAVALPFSAAYLPIVFAFRTIVLCTVITVGLVIYAIQKFVRFVHFRASFNLCGIKFMRFRLLTILKTYQNNYYNGKDEQ